MEKMIGTHDSYYIHPSENKEFALGHVHTPPFPVRVFLNNNTAEFDTDTLWKINSNVPMSDQPEFNIFGHHKLADKEPLTGHIFEPLVHDEILRLISSHEDNDISYDEAVQKAVQGKIDLTLLRDPSAVWNALVQGHVDKIISENKAATISGNFLNKLIK